MKSRNKQEKRKGFVCEEVIWMEGLEQ